MTLSIQSQRLGVNSIHWLLKQLLNHLSTLQVDTLYSLIIYNNNIRSMKGNSMLISQPPFGLLAVIGSFLIAVIYVIDLLTLLRNLCKIKSPYKL